MNVCKNLGMQIPNVKGGGSEKVLCTSRIPMRLNSPDSAASSCPSFFTILDAPGFVKLGT